MCVQRVHLYKRGYSYKDLLELHLCVTKPCEGTIEIATPVDDDRECSRPDTIPGLNWPSCGCPSPIPESSRHTCPRHSGVSSGERPASPFELESETPRHYHTLPRPRCPDSFYCGSAESLQSAIDKSKKRRSERDGQDSRATGIASIDGSEEELLCEDCVSKVLHISPRRRWGAESFTEEKSKSSRHKYCTPDSCIAHLRDMSYSPVYVTPEQEHQDELDALARLERHAQLEEEMYQFEQANPLPYWSRIPQPSAQRELDDLPRGDYTHRMSRDRSPRVPSRLYELADEKVRKELFDAGDEVEHLEHDLLKVSEKLEEAELRHEEAELEAMRSHEEREAEEVERLVRRVARLASEEEDGEEVYKPSRRHRW
jgi:hypothetical protein